MSLSSRYRYYLCCALKRGLVAYMSVVIMCHYSASYFFVIQIYVFVLFFFCTSHYSLLAILTLPHHDVVVCIKLLLVILHHEQLPSRMCPCRLMTDVSNKKVPERVCISKQNHDQHIRKKPLCEEEYAIKKN